MTFVTCGCTGVAVAFPWPLWAALALQSGVNWQLPSTRECVPFGVRRFLPVPRLGGRGKVGMSQQCTFGARNGQALL